MIIEPPKTKQELLAARKTIVELMANPYADQFMFLSLSKKLDEIDIKIASI